MNDLNGLKIVRKAKEFWELTTKLTMTYKLASLDLSPRRVGIAISDASREFAVPRGVLNIHRKDGITLDTTREGHYLIKQLRREVQNVTGWVIGWPLDLSGKEGYRTMETFVLIEQLQVLLGTTFGNVLLHDERFTTVLARADLLEYPQASHIGIDALAAARILQEYLDLSNRNFS